MPRWLPHRRDWRPLRLRWGIEQPLAESWSGILHTAQVDRDWHRDELGVMGAWGQSWLPGTDPDQVAGVFHSVTLHNPTGAASSEANSVAREFLVHKVSAWIGREDTGTMPGLYPFHICNGLKAYFPAGGGGVDGWLPSLRPVYVPFVNADWGADKADDVGDESIQLGTGHLDAGIHTGLQTISIAGVPTDTIGPSWEVHTQAFAGAFNLPYPTGWADVWNSNNPPLRLKPGQRFVVQGLAPMASTAVLPQVLRASFWWSVRDFHP